MKIFLNFTKKINLLQIICIGPLDAAIIRNNKMFIKCKIIFINRQSTYPKVILASEKPYVELYWYSILF